MKNRQRIVLSAMVASGVATTNLLAASFGSDLAFLQNHTPIVLLSDATGMAKVAIAPAWQGRVMTSTAGGDNGISFGWINRELIASRKIQPHINVFGGEDRFWIGPEGGQFSVFFAPGAKFELSDWQTPAPIDTMPWQVVKQSRKAASFTASFSLSNFSGARFDIKADREVVLLPLKSAARQLGTSIPKGVSLVAYESVNRIQNAGKQPWSKQTGLLSIWVLGMFNHSPETTVVVPIREGAEALLGTKVTSDYFGEIPPDRLAVNENVIYFSGDGQFRSKIGISPRRSKGVLGSYDSKGKVLTIVQFTQPEGVTDYVNSLWKLQDNPFGGDAVNSYNDGPASPGAKPLGPFYELESSSPAAALAPGKRLTHVHRTIHLSGADEALDPVSRAVLGVSIEHIRNGLRKQR